MKYKIRRKKKGRNTFIILIIFILISIVMTAGYAIWQQDLKVTGSAKAEGKLVTVTFYVPVTAIVSNNNFTNPTHALDRYDRTDTSTYAYTEATGTYTREIVFAFENIGNANSYLANGAPVNLPTDRTVTFESCEIYATLGCWIDSATTWNANYGDARITSPVSMGFEEGGQLNKGAKWNTYNSSMTIPARGSTISCTFRGRFTSKYWLTMNRNVRTAVTNLYLKIEASYWQ